MKLTILKTHPIFKIFLLSSIAIIVSNAHAGKLYNWVDANGNISYPAQPPPKSGKILSEKEVISKASDTQEIDTGLPKVVVYSVRECELCDRLIRVLKENKVPHIELPLEGDREAQKKILAKASSIIAPTIFIGDTIVQGGSEGGLKEQLRSAGFEIEPSKQVKPKNRLNADQ
jgi:glutaredoxin